MPPYPKSVRNLLAALAALGALASCSPVHQYSMLPGDIPSFSTPAQAIKYARSRVAAGDPTIAFRLPVVDAPTVKAIAGGVIKETTLSTLDFKAMGDMVIIEPKYSEDVLLLRAYQNPALEATLNPAQQRALATARRAVAEANRYGSDYERAMSLHDFLVANTCYVTKSATQNLDCCTTAVLADGEGVCEGYTRAYRLLLTMAGIECLYVNGTTRGNPHCWNLVKLGGQWVHVDCTYDDPLPDAPGRVIHSFFGMSDSLLAASHKWDRSAVPSAPSSSQYYPFRYGWHFATMQDFVNYCATHRMPSGCVTVYIDELGRPGADPGSLLAVAQYRIGSKVVTSFSVAPSNPCAFNCICAH